MTTVRKGDVDEQGEGGGQTASALPVSDRIVMNVIRGVFVHTPGIIVIAIPVAFVWGIGTGIIKRAFRLGHRLTG